MRNIDDSDMKISIDRRSFLGITGASVAATLPGVLSTPAVAEPSVQAHISERRKLGSLEVSTLGLGVQNMSRKYETTVPYRPEMINVIRAAYDRGIALANDGRLQRQEPVMKSIIDLGSELLFDRSRVASPDVRLLVTAIGHELARGSPWVSVNKRVLAVYEIGPELITTDPEQRLVA